MVITEWPISDRPREKLLDRGPQALTDTELLAIFLRTGVKGKTAIDLARELLQLYGLRGILTADRRTFCQHHGVGDAKYALLQACLELSRRHFYQELRHGALLDNPSKVSDFLLCHLSHRKKEIFCGLFLDIKHRLLAFEDLAVGTLNQVVIYPRELVARVLHYEAAALIIVHNHPSGDVTPSQEDERITAQLKQTLADIEVKLLDHFIVGACKIFSFADQGLLL